MSDESSGASDQSAIDFISCHEFGCTRIPVENHSIVRPSNESKIRPVRPMIATLFGDYVASNVWALQDPVRLSNESTSEA